MLVRDNVQLLWDGLPVTLEWLEIGIISVIGVALGAFFRVGPGRRTAEMADALLGKPESKDRSGTVTSPAQPGLVALQQENAARLATVEETLVELRHVVGLWTETAKRVDLVEDRVTVAEARLNVVETSHVRDVINAAERAATAAASAETLRLIGRVGDIDEDAS